MRWIILFFATVIGGMVYIQQAMQDGSVLRYIDTHAHEKGVPQATYAIGQTLYIFQNLPDATTYFLRVAQRYPSDSLGDDGYYYYLRCLTESQAVTHAELYEGYKAYLEKYPNGKHIAVANGWVGNYRPGK